MPASKTAALVGATGDLGHLIVLALLEQDGTEVRCLVRPSSLGKAERLVGAGASLVEGDLDDHAALARLCEGADVVVSAIQGGPNVIVDGQRLLLEAARAAGVRRLIPSDFSYDIFGLEPGANPNTDWRRQFAEVAAAEQGEVDTVHVFNGCFTDRRVLFGFLGAFDLESGTAHLWGDGAAPMDFTTYADTARYTAALATDEGNVPPRFKAAGDVLTFHELVAAYEAGSGRSLTVKRHGSLSDLSAEIEKRQTEDPQNVFAYLPLMYWRAMLSGKVKLDPLHNDRYPGVKPTTVRAYVEKEGL